MLNAIMWRSISLSFYRFLCPRPGSFLGLFVFFGLLATLPVAVAKDQVSQYQVERILRLDINSSINPATYNYFKEGIKRAERENFQAVLITMNTPGGLVSTTKDILTLFGDQDLPIVIWVTPEGASATSAGAIISSGAHLLYMATGTNMGAAAPVMMGKDIDTPKVPGKKKKESRESQESQEGQTPAAEDSLKGASDMKKKAVNDLVALVTSLAEARGRNPEPFKKMISEAESYTAKQALEQQVINGIANNEEDIFNSMHDQLLTVRGQKQYLQVADRPSVVKHQMDLGQKLLNIFANPSLAYLLFLAGAALIYFELQAPGGLIAGATGAILLLLAGIGFQVLPLNFGALGLIILAFILFVVEMFVASFGLISVAGLASLVIGSLFLFRGDTGAVVLPPPLVYSVAAAVALFLFLMGTFIVKKMRKNHGADDVYDMKGRRGTILSIKSQEGDQWRYGLRVYGEIWEAIGPASFKEGDEVIVTEYSTESMQLKIDKESV